MNTSEASDLSELFKEMFVPTNPVSVGLAKGYDLDEELQIMFERNINKHPGDFDINAKLKCIERDFNFELIFLYDQKTGKDIFRKAKAKVYQDKETKEIKFKLEDAVYNV